jgi:hypothetical protein
MKPWWWNGYPVGMARIACDMYLLFLNKPSCVYISDNLEHTCEISAFSGGLFHASSRVLDYRLTLGIEKGILNC